MTDAVVGLPPTVIQDPTLAYVMGWAEYPFMELAHVAEQQGLGQVESEMRVKATVAGLDASRAWLINLRQAIELAEANEPLRVARQNVVSSSKILGELTLTLSEIRELSQKADALVRQAREQGASWATIGKSIGVTPQSAHQRWSGKIRTAHLETEHNKSNSSKI